MTSAVIVDRTSPARDKIGLFRSLFRGREDVYPRRIESRKTGKSGYAPACASEGVRGISEKPRIKCALCAHRRFLPVTDVVVRWHLSGRDEGGHTRADSPLARARSCLNVPCSPAMLQSGRSLRLRSQLGQP
jgi:hypothetical protein